MIEAEYIANLHRCCDESLTQPRERYESFRDGGGGVVKRPDVIIQHMAVTPASEDQALELVAERDGARLEATTHALELPETWQEFSSLTCQVQLLDQLPDALLPVKISLIIVGTRNRIEQSWDLRNTEVTSLSISLNDLPLSAGTRPSWTPTGIRLSVQWGDTWPSEGACILQGMPWAGTENNAPIKLKFFELNYYHEKMAMI